jgi:hypothetical protein
MTQRNPHTGEWSGDAGRASFTTLLAGQLGEPASLARDLGELAAQDLDPAMARHLQARADFVEFLGAQIAVADAAQDNQTAAFFAEITPTEETNK